MTIAQDVLLIDVREPDEIQQGMIPSAVSLPLSQMREAFDPKAPEGDFYKVGGAWACLTRWKLASS